MPFVHSLTVDVSGRYDHFSDFGDTENFKLGASYEPFEELTIRGSYGTSFDAPSLADTLAPDGRLQYTAQRTSPNLIVPPGTSAADALRPSVLVPGGNPNLGPEGAHTSSIGADFRPGDVFGMDFTGLELSITGWHVGIAHQIALAPYNQVTLFQIPAYAKYYIINPTAAQLAAYGYNVIQSFPGPDINSAYTNGVNPPYIAYDARRNNIGNAYVDGLDFAINYTKDFDFGAISGGLSGTTTLSNRTGFPGATFSSIQANGVPLYSLSANLGITSGPWTARASINYSPSYLQNPAAQAVTLYHQTRVGSFEPFNLFASYDLDGIASWTGGASISATLNNVFDEHPPIILSGGTANGTTLGRYLVIGLHKSF